MRLQIFIKVFICASIIYFLLIKLVKVIRDNEPIRLRYKSLYFILALASILFNFYFRPIDGNPRVNDTYRKSDMYINDLYYSNEEFREQLLGPKTMLYDSLKEAGLNNTQDIYVECEMGCVEYIDKSVEALYLDHPELLGFQSFIYYYDTSKNEVHASNTGTITSLQIALGTKRIQREIDAIQKETKDMSDKDKILYVYNYVAQHNYDRVFTSLGSNQSIYSFFTRRTSVCSGFAKVSQILFQNIGINSKLIVNNDHLWNIVEYEGKWYIFDSTMGASYTDKTNKDYYDGLGKTTVNEIYGHYKENYPEIDTTPLRTIFDV